MKRILYISIFLFVILCEYALSQNYVQTSPRRNGTNEYYPFRVSHEDARTEISYQNINFLADTIFSIGFNIEDRGSSYEHAYAVMYNFEINFRENSGAWQTVYSGNFAPVQGEWNYVFLDIPYIKQSSNDLEVSICFNNCERNPITIVGDRVTFITVIDDVGPNGNPSTLGNIYYNRTNGNLYSDKDNGCTITMRWGYSEVPWTRFGYGNVNRKTINVCSSNDSITIFGTSSVLPDLSTTDINNDGVNDFNGPYQFNNGNFISYHYRSKGTQFNNLYWINADYICQSIGAHLSHIETRVENNFILNNVHSNHDRWIGAYQNCNSSSFSEPSGGWQWTNGSPVSTNYNINSWRSSGGTMEPNNDNNNEHYAMMYSSGNALAGLWNDQPVTRSARFLMEVEDIYVWSTGDTTSTAELTIANTNSLSNSIIWMERLVEEGGRTFKKREYFTFNTVSGPSVSVTSSPSNKVCEGSSILLQATGADNYRWNHGPLTATDSVSPTMPTTYTVVGTDNNGCENTDSLLIQVDQLPSNFIISPNNQVICWGDAPIDLNTTIDTNFLNESWNWSTNLSPLNGSFIQNNSIQNISFDRQNIQNSSSSSSGIIGPNDTLKVFLEYLNGSCSYKDTNNIIFTRPEKPILSHIPNPACAGDSLKIVAASNINNLEYRFEYQDVNGNWNNFNPIWNGNNFINTIISQQTNYRVRVRETSSNYFNCFSSKLQSIIVVPYNLISTSPIYHN